MTAYLFAYLTVSFCFLLLAHGIFRRTSKIGKRQSVMYVESHLEAQFVSIFHWNYALSGFAMQMPSQEVGQQRNSEAEKYILTQH
jgi:hypothetical protein